MFPIKNAVPSRYPPVVTRWLIAVNCGVFLFQLSLSPSELEAFLHAFALVPARFFGPYVGAELSPVDFLAFITNTFISTCG